MHMMPIAYIAASLRAELSDMVEALKCGRADDARDNRDRILELIEELEGHDGAEEKVAANDTEVRQ
jgi:hypothetical protein